MKRRHDVGRLLRWYPSSWRARYGEEFVALLEDRLADAPLTLRVRLSVAYAGVRERCYGSGMIGTRGAPSTQRRNGSLTVLVAWSILAVGGLSLEKMAEHFGAAMPPGSRAVATGAFDTAAASGLLGTLLLLVGVVVALPGFVRLCRTQKWHQIRRTFASSLVATGVAVIATAGLVPWAHHLNNAQRNGGSDLYSVAFVAVGLVVMTTIGLWTRASIATASRIDFTDRELQRESYLAMGVSLSSVVVVTSATIWWIQVALHAPWFLSGAAYGVSSSPWSTQAVVTMLAMGLGVATALWGGSRVALSYRMTRTNT